MVNTKILLEVVKDNGLTLKGVAKKLGISYMSLYRKTRNVSPFRVSEVEMMCRIVGISTKAEKDRIFFADKYDNLSTNGKKA